MGERVTVEGTVENVIFHNEENGYTVLLLTVEGEEEPVTVVGCIPCAAAGEGMTVTAAAWWEALRNSSSSLFCAAMMAEASAGSPGAMPSSARSIPGRDCCAPGGRMVIEPMR